MATVHDADLSGLVPERGTLLVGALWLNTLFVAAALYYVATGASFRVSAFTLRPLVYLALGGVALYATTPRAAGGRQRRIGVAVAAGYFLLLALANGIVAPGVAFFGREVPATGLRLSTVVPFGYGPSILYTGELLILKLQPAALVGYGALAYLVYASVLDAAEVAYGGYLGGFLGLFTCISCTWAVIAPLVGGGAATTALAAVGETQHALSIAVYVVTVALLSWRPFR